MRYPVTPLLGVNLATPSGRHVKNEWSLTSTFPHVFLRDVQAQRQLYLRIHLTTKTFVFHEHVFKILKIF
jgi:hypothetical protein